MRSCVEGEEPKWNRCRGGGRGGGGAAVVVSLWWGVSERLICQRGFTCQQETHFTLCTTPKDSRPYYCIDIQPVQRRREPTSTPTHHPPQILDRANSPPLDPSLQTAIPALHRSPTQRWGTGSAGASLTEAAALLHWAATEAL